MKNTVRLMIGILVLLALALPARSAASGNDAEAAKAKCPSRVAVTVEALQPAAFTETAWLAGTARAEAIVVASPVAGTLSEVRVSEGSLVDAGQELALLNAELLAGLKELESEAARRKKILTARQNWKEKSERAIQVAERDYQAALAKLEEAKALAGRAVTSPLAGIVRLKSEAGAAVEAGAPLFEIVDPLHLRVEAETADAGLFTVGETLDAKAEGVDDVFAAEVVAVGDGKVALRLDNGARRLEDGAAVTCGKLKASHEQALLVPLAAVQQDGLGDYVYVAEKKNARKAYVTIAAREAGKAMIGKGIDAGALVIVSGFDCLADKKGIRVVNAAAQAVKQAEADRKAQIEKEKKAQAEAVAAEKARLEQEKQAQAAEAKAKKEEERQAKADADAAARAQKEQERKAKAEAAAAAKAEKKAQAAAAKAGKETGKKAPAAAACPKRVDVQTEQVAAGLFRAYGYFKAQALPEEAAVAAPEAGWVYSLSVSEGAQVELGGELLVLVVGGSEKTAGLRQDVERKAKVLADRREANAGQRSIQAAERDLQRAKALLEKDIAPYARTLTAPLAGVVKGLQAVAGADVVAAAPLLSLATESSLLITLALPTARELGFEEEQTLDVQPVGQELMLAAQVVSVDENGAVLRLDNREGKVQAGVQVIVRKLSSEHADAVTAPSQAVLNDSMGDFVYLAEKKKARKVYVGVGPSEAGRTLIEKGLAAGSQLIVSGFECLGDKKRVRVVTPEAAREAAGGRDEFLAFLEANRAGLGIERFEALEWKGQPAVRIRSGREAQKKLLEALPRFAVSGTTFELEGEQVVSTVTFAAPAAPAKPAEVPVAAEKAPRLRIGVHGSYFLMLDSNFKETYGGLMGFGGELSYRFAQKMDFWVSGGMAGKKATPEWSSDEMKFSLIPLAAAVRYYLGGKGKLSPYAGAGVNVFLVEDQNPIVDIKETLIGFHALGGFYYGLSSKLSAQFTAKFNIASKDVVPESDLDDPLSLMGLELRLGVSYAF